MTEAIGATRPTPRSLPSGCRLRRRASPGAWAGSLLLSALLWGCGDGARPNVLLITIDTLRADRVGAYGYGAAGTATLDALAQRGVRFDQAVSPTPITLPSHCTLMTGLTPPFHGVRDNGIYRLGPEPETLAGAFGAAGYQTAAFVGAYVLDQTFGLARGFGTYDDHMGSGRSHVLGYAERPAGEVVDSAIEWLRTAPRAPFFLWVHVYDPHANYEPPPGFALAFRGRPYDAEIAYADFQIGRLLEALEELGAAGDTFVVATSDHGESLGEHGERTHTHFLYEATQRIPLLVAGPGLAGGRVVEQPVGLVDLAPTLLELAGLPVWDSIQGRSLLPLLRGEPREAGDLYLETLATRAMGWSPLLALRSGSEKYVRAPRPELYDLATDPGEREDLAASRPARVRELDARLEALLTNAPAGDARQPIDAESRRRLEALGYVVDGAGHAPSDAAQIDPKDMIHQAEWFDLAGSHLTAGNLREAARYAGKLTEESPDARLYVALEALIRLRLGEAARARELALHATRIDPGDVNAWILLAETEGLSGRREAAREAFDRARALRPDYPALIAASVTTALDAGELEEAEARLAEVPAEQRADADMLLLEGRIHEARGVLDEARAVYRRAREITADHPGATLRLALFELREGRIAEGQTLLESVGVLPAIGFRERYEIARAFAAGGAPDLAISTLAPFVEQGTESPHVLEGYGSLLLEAGRTDEAEAALRRAIALAPDHLVAVNNLASLLAREGRRLEEALTLAERVYDAAPGPFSADTLAEVHLARGEASRALDLSERFLPESDPLLAGHLQLLRARALDRLGRRVEARAALDQALATADSLPARPAWAAEASELRTRLGPAG